MINAQIIGHIGKDAELKKLDNGSQVINFNVASSETYTNKDGVKTEVTTWCSCSWFFAKDKDIKIAQYLKKGVQVYCTGSPAASHYVNQNKDVISELKLKVDSLMLLGKPNNGSSKTTNDAAPEYGSKQ